MTPIQRQAMKWAVLQEGGFSDAETEEADVMSAIAPVAHIPYLDLDAKRKNRPTHSPRRGKPKRPRPKGKPEREEEKR